MGSLCCCACIDEFEEYNHPGNLIYRHCSCLRFLFHQLISGKHLECCLKKHTVGVSLRSTPSASSETALNESALYGAMFHRLEGRSVQSGVTALTSSGIGTSLNDNSPSDTQLAVSRPIPYDTSEQRYSRLQRDGLVSRREKSMIHFQDETHHPLRRNVSSSGAESLGFGKKQNAVDSKEDSKLVHSESSDRALAAKMAYGVYNVQMSAEDEDVCPTCLDEYTPENPKITTRCSHHFHLGCIYEWLERSESCPICGKEMDFCESP